MLFDDSISHAFGACCYSKSRLLCVQTIMLVFERCIFIEWCVLEPAKHFSMVKNNCQI